MTVGHVGNKTRKDAMAKLLEIRKGTYRRDVCILGHRVFSFIRKGAVVDSMLRILSWQADYRALRQHGIELPGEAAYYWTGHYEIVEVRLGDLRGYWNNGPVSLSESDLGKFASGEDKGALRRYYDKMAEATSRSKESADEGVAASERLFKSLESADYDPSICCITINDGNVILDGFHRSAFLLAKHGPDYRIKVVRVLPDFK